MLSQAPGDARNGGPFTRCASDGKFFTDAGRFNGSSIFSDATPHANDNTGMYSETVAGCDKPKIVLLRVYCTTCDGI